MSQKENSRTSAILFVLFFFIFVLIDFGFYVEEPIDSSALVTSLATALVLKTNNYGHLPFAVCYLEMPLPLRFLPHLHLRPRRLRLPRCRLRPPFFAVAYG